jgi:hypothetical protein
MTNVLNTSQAARLLGVTRPMIYRLGRLGFLKEPYTRAAVQRAWDRWEADKSERKTVRAAPSELKELDLRERIRSLELVNLIRARTLVPIDHCEAGACAVLGLLKNDVAALEGRAVSEGGDLAKIGAMTDAALLAAVGVTNEAAARCVAARVEPVEIAEPIAANLRDREKLARYKKRKAANDKLDDAHIRADEAIGNIEWFSKLVHQAFADIPNAEVFVLAPVASRAASVIECLRTGVDPTTLIEKWS